MKRLRNMDQKTYGNLVHLKYWPRSSSYSLTITLISTRISLELSWENLWFLCELPFTQDWLIGNKRFIQGYHCRINALKTEKKIKPIPIPDGTCHTSNVTIKTLKCNHLWNRLQCPPGASWSFTNHFKGRYFCPKGIRPSLSYYRKSTVDFIVYFCLFVCWKDDGEVLIPLSNGLYAFKVVPDCL